MTSLQPDLFYLILVVLYLLAAPQFTVSPEKLARNLLSFPVGNSVKMDCSADGYPRPTVRWYKDGKLFTQRKGRSRLYLSPFSLALTMRGLVPSDSGKYTCNVSNAHVMSYYLFMQKGSQIKSYNDLGVVIRCPYSQKTNSTAKCVLCTIDAKGNIDFWKPQSLSCPSRDTVLSGTSINYKPFCCKFIYSC